MTAKQVAMKHAEIVAELRRQFTSNPPARIGIAVSGGGDSVALLHLLHDCFRDQPVELMAATVDHRLRDASRSEAEYVATLAADLGIRHEILSWQEGPQESGNLQDQAREARYRLLSAWARKHGIPVLTLGHTADDQAETVLMRLKRASGVSGLAGIPQRRTLNGVGLLRPLLEVRRDTLRQYLQARGTRWIEDPSNDDETFERIRMRKALGALEDLGLTVEALSTVAQNMHKARRALDWYVFLAARDMARFEAGAIVFELRKFRTLPDEISHRLLLEAILWISGGQYPPRRLPMIEAVATAQRGNSTTLAGCRILSRKCGVWICREFNAVRDHSARSGDLWDQRWRVYAGELGGCEVRALGPVGLAQCPDWRATSVPGPVLEVTPALWEGDDLKAAPVAGYANGSSAEPKNSAEEFFASLLSH